MLNEDVLRKVIPNINDVNYGVVKNVRVLTEKEIGDFAKTLAKNKDKQLVLNYEDALNLLATCLQSKSCSTTIQGIARVSIPNTAQIPVFNGE